MLKLNRQKAAVLLRVCILALFVIWCETATGYINPIRGHYQQAPQSPGQLAGIELRFKIIDVLNEACDNLSKACTINIIGLPVEDLAVANKVAQIIDRLKIDINEIQSFGQTPPKRRKDID